jgi:hypothetical protein
MKTVITTSWSSSATPICRLTARGWKLGVLLVKLGTRLLGPLTTLVTAPAPQPQTTHASQVEAAFRQVDLAIDHLCTTLGLKPAA